MGLGDFGYGSGVRRPATVPGLILVLLLAAAGRVEAATVAILRDDWGIPHIWAETAEAALYAHGWAQAEDRLADLLLAYAAADGRAASVLGESRVERDFEARVARHTEIARERFGELEPDTRRRITAFVAGVRAYMAEHPDEVPPWGRAPDPPDVVAAFRAFHWSSTSRQSRSDLRRGFAKAEVGESNAWIVGPSRTASGAPIALIDPHLPWEPESRIYESGVHGGDLDFYGFSLVGTPWMVFGHNAALSIASTVGGPDTADVYEERVDPDDPTRYAYDGSWRPIERETITITVKRPVGSRTVERVVERTHHGPILFRDGMRAFSARTAYDREIGSIEQSMNMVRARNIGEFLVSLGANQSLPQNLLAADIYGNSYYIRAGRVPRRPPMPNWSAPVAGSESTTEWLGIHPMSDLVQCLNPSPGFLQGSNDSPATLTPQSPLTADRYRPELYNAPADRPSPQADRILALLTMNDQLTVDGALSIAVDTEVIRAGNWQRALLGAFARRSAEFAHVSAAVQLLVAWDRRIGNDSRAAALYRFWMRQIDSEAATLGIPVADIDAGRAIEADGEFALLRSLVHAAKWMTEHVGRLDVPWGELHRIRRGERSWPIAGGRDERFDLLRSVRFGAPDARGISEAVGGLSCPTVVVLRREGIESWSATPFGQSNQPGSPHFADQAERLTSQGKLKRNRLRKEEVLEHLTAKRELVVPAF